MSIRLADGAHNISCKIDGIGAMGLKSANAEDQRYPDMRAPDGYALCTRCLRLLSAGQMHDVGGPV